MGITLPKKKIVFHTKTLEKPMLDKDILSQWKPEECTLSDFAWALKHSDTLLTNGYANIFYIRDSKGTLWAVYCFWDSDRRYWYVYAFSVEDPNEWRAGNRVFSRRFFDTADAVKDKTLTLMDFKTKKSLEPKLVEFRIGENRYRLVEE